MAIMNAQELRTRAAELRLMAADGDDLPLKIALLHVAEDFEREAVEADRGRVREIIPPVCRYRQGAAGEKTDAATVGGAPHL